MYSVAIEVDDVDAAVHDLRERDIRVAGPEHGAWIGSRIARIDPASAASTPCSATTRRSPRGSPSASR
jgi:hypothetical protein